MIAAITAGGRVGGGLARALDTDVKALARFGDVALVDIAIAAARAAGAQRVAVIGGEAIRSHCAGSVDDLIPESLDGRENIRRAIAAAANGPLLLMTSDLPFITGSAITAFLERCAPADLALPLAGAAAYEAAYPNAPPHLTRVGTELVANGSIVYFGPGVAPRALDSAQRLFAARKSLLRMAALLGPRLLVRYVCGRLRIEDVERRARMLLGIDACAVRDCAPELCFDIDTIADYRYALAYRERA